MERTKIQIRSYQKAWDIDKRIYAFFNWSLPVPVSLKGVVYFFTIAGMIFLLNVMIPLLHEIPSMVKYLMLPVVLTQFCLKIKLEGKRPQRYLKSLVQYLATRHQYIERFKSQSPVQNQDFRLTWLCSRGVEE